MAAQTKSRITRVTSPDVPKPAPGTWSNCLVVNGVAYVAGMVARGKDGKAAGDEYDQAKEIFAKIRSLLEAAGAAMADVVKVVIFVTDIKNREEVWKARREVFTRRLSRRHAGAGRGPGLTRHQGRDRSRRPYRRGPALTVAACHPGRSECAESRDPGPTTALRYCSGSQIPLARIPG